MASSRGNGLTPDPEESAKTAGLRYVADAGLGIVRRRAGQGFRYLNVDRKPVRDQATLNRIKSLAIPPAWKDVWICPLANGHLQATGRDARGRKQYRYHPRYRKVRDTTKFSRMAAFGAALPKIRRKIEEDLALPGLPREKVLAVIVRLLDETVVRVGNDEYVKSNDSFGLTTLRDRHVKVRGPRIRLRFRGKSKQAHDIQLSDRRLARIVKQCQDLPGEELFQYESESGEYVKVDSGDVNEYLRQITAEDFTAKDFRTWHGTGYMIQELAEVGLPHSKEEAKHNIVAAVKATAKRLGNRPAACRNYYVHPVVVESYTNQTMFENIQRSGSVDKRRRLREKELAILHLIETYDSKGSEFASARGLPRDRKAS